jgi:protein-disulfide isomerase
LLGRPDAPVVVEEYADLQCPVCAVAARDTLPPLIRDYVRSGRVRLRLRTLTFLGRDSVVAGRAAVSAGLQDRQWDFVERFYADQGQENSGYVTPDFLRAVARAVPGLDPERVLSRTADAEVDTAIAADAAAQERNRVAGTPTFLVGRRGGELRPTEGFGIDQLRAAIDPLLAEQR